MPFTAAITGFHRSQLFGPMLAPGSSNMNGVEPAPTTFSLSPVVAHRLGAIDAGAEGLVPRAGEHHAAHVVVAPQPRPQRVQLVLHLHVERVVHVGAVERHPGNTVPLFVQQGLVGLDHATPSCRSRDP